MELVATGEAFIRRGATVAKVIDQYGDERIIYRQKGMKDLRIKNTGTTKTLELNRIASNLLAANIKKMRLKKGYTLAELATKAGLKGIPKIRMYEIEKNTRKEGLRLGTIYALAEALGTSIFNLMPTADEVFRKYNE